MIDWKISLDKKPDSKGNRVVLTFKAFASDLQGIGLKSVWWENLALR